ncbi:MAG: hypothetical protein U0S76_09330, partial [Pseudoxanthomonas sp.]|nr:hypothetical protein [Pseudoxanthomonas sp.]
MPYQLGDAPILGERPGILPGSRLADAGQARASLALRPACAGLRGRHIHVPLIPHFCGMISGERPGILPGSRLADAGQARASLALRPACAGLRGRHIHVPLIP